MGVKDIILVILLCFPIITLIHEIGHACIAKLYGAKLNKIVIGKGSALLKIKRLEIRKIFFWFGFCSLDKWPNSNFSKVMIYLGGILFNLVTALTCILLVEFKVIAFNNFLRLFINTSFLVIITALAPIVYNDGRESDGRQIIKLIKRS